MKEEYLKNYEYYGSANRMALENTKKDTKSVLEELQILCMVQKVMKTECEVSVQLIILVIMLVFGTFIFQFSIPTVILFIVGFFLTKECVKKLDEYPRNKFLKLHPKYSDLFYKSRKEINQSILELNNHLEQSYQTEKILNDRYVRVCRDRFVLQKSSDDSIEKIEEMKLQLVQESGDLVYPCNNIFGKKQNENIFISKLNINIKQLKTYRELLIQLEKERSVSDIHIYNAKEAHENIKVKTLENGQIVYRPNDL